MKLVKLKVRTRVIHTLDWKSETIIEIIDLLCVTDIVSYLQLTCIRCKVGWYWYTQSGVESKLLLNITKIGNC